MVKEDVKTAEAQSSHIQSQQKYKDFDQVTAKSVKVPRGPRILDNEFTRLTQKTDLARRRICSEGKARQKVKKEREEV